MKKIVLSALFFFAFLVSEAQYLRKVTNINYAGDNGLQHSNLVEFNGFVPFNNSLYYTASYNYFADYQLCRYSESPISKLRRTDIEGFSIFPNPVKDVLNIKTGQAIVSTKIIDISGRVLKEITEIESNSMPVNELSAGL